MGQVLKTARDITAALMAPRSTLSQVHLYGLIPQASLAMSVKTHLECVLGDVLVLRGRLTDSEKWRDDITRWVDPNQQPHSHLAAHTLPSPAGSGGNRRKVRRQTTGELSTLS